MTKDAMPATTVIAKTIYPDFFVRFFILLFHVLGGIFSISKEKTNNISD
jgi:hypothetical protein